VASQQQWITETSSPYVALGQEVARAASAYQREREAEAAQLNRMAAHDLSIAWSSEVRETVLATRESVQGARAARREFRAHVRDFVLKLRDQGVDLSTVLRRARALLQSLQAVGAVHDDGGWFEAEVLEWAIEDFVE
jgi:hypothetical protein